MTEIKSWTDKKGRSWPKTMIATWENIGYDTGKPYNIHERIDIEPDGKDRLILCAMDRIDDTQWSDKYKECIWIFKEWVPEIIELLKNWAEMD